MSHSRGVSVSHPHGVSVSDDDVDPHFHGAIVVFQKSVKSSLFGDDDEVDDDDEDTTSQVGIAHSSHRGSVPAPL